MKPLLIALYLSLSVLVAGCAVSPQTITIVPQTNLSGPFYGQGRTLTIEVEDRRARTFFRLLSVISFCAVVAASLAQFYIIANAQEYEFQEQFEASAIQVLDSFEKTAMQKFEALSSLGVAFTAQALGQNLGQNHTSWPFVTLDDFQQRAASV